MNARLLAIDAIFLAFAALSVAALMEFGYVGIWASILDSTASMQVGADLVISCFIAMGFIRSDAHRRGINPWPFLVGAVFLGSFAPLAYLGWREWNRTPSDASQPARA